MGSSNIQVGVTGWNDHPDLYPAGKKSAYSLSQYAIHFPIVEVDASFYAILPVRNYEKWATQTPETFGFVVKAYQGLTGHTRGQTASDLKAQFATFRTSIQPLLESTKLKAILFQYPPWFECSKSNVDFLRKTRKEMKDYPLAIEFRHQSWYEEQWREKTLRFLQEEEWIHTICDEPQAGRGSVPIVLSATHKDLTLVRFHGRNTEGWQQRGRNDESWREVRYLYRYSEAELLEWVERLEKLKQQTDRILVLFNNNSGKDAANNAKQLMKLLGILPPPIQVNQTAQLELFE